MRQQLLAQFAFARQFFWHRHLRHLGVILEPWLGIVERDAHDEHRPPVLDARHAARGEAAAIAHAFHLIDDRDLGSPPSRK